MWLEVSDAGLRAIREHAEAAYPHECCGLLLGEGGEGGGGELRVVREVVRGTNIAPRAAWRDRYRLDPRDYLRASRHARSRGWDVIGVYHSHPDAAAVPSATDLAEAWPGYVYVIAAVHGGSTSDLTAWRLAPPDAAAAPSFQPVRLVTEDGPRRR